VCAPMTLLDALSGGRHKLTNLKSGPAAKSGQVLQHNRGEADMQVVVQGNYIDADDPSRQLAAVD